LPDVDSLARTAAFYGREEAHATRLVNELCGEVSALAAMAVELGMSRSGAEEMAAAVSNRDR
jgi:hypothetical protein